MIAKIIQLPYNREMAWLQDSVNNSTSHHYSKKTCRFGKYSCMNLWKRTPSYSTQPRVEYQYFRRILWIYIFFLMLVLLRRTSFLTNFYGLYFNQWCTYIFTYYISIVGLWGQLSCSASTPMSIWHVVGTPSCCNSCIVLCPYPHIAMSDSHHDVPELYFYLTSSKYSINSKNFIRQEPGSVTYFF